MASTIRRAAAVVTSLTGRTRKPRYQSLPTGQEDLDDGQITPTEFIRKASRRSTVRCNLILFTLAAVGLVGMTYGVMRTADGAPSTCDDVNNGYQCDEGISHYWGQYSPYFSIPSEISADVPDQCEITFAQILSRHGARDPTAIKTEIYHDVVNHIQSRALRFPGSYHFLKTYEYNLGADQLTVFGEKEMVNSGLKFYQRYQALAKDTVPFVRTAGQKRVVMSAQNWTRGFHDAWVADQIASAPDAYPYKIVILDEGKAFNNTLSHDSCTNYDTFAAEEAQKEWAAIFTPDIVQRVNAKLRGTHFDAEHVIYLMDLCPMNTVASVYGQISPFCKIFYTGEWQDYDYYQSLGKYYGFANGNPLGATQGVGYVNELIARLTNRPVADHTNTNSTLDSSEETFPVGELTKLFADFSHDNDISQVLAALGLYNATKPLSKTSRQTPQEMGGYAASWTVPFAARVYFEKMKCAGQEEEYVRILINDRVIPLQNCGGDELGRCKLSQFVDSLSFAQDGGDWDKCFI